MPSSSFQLLQSQVWYIARSQCKCLVHTFDLQGQTRPIQLSVVESCSWVGRNGDKIMTRIHKKKHTKKSTKLTSFELVFHGVSWPFYWNKAIAFKQNMTNSGFWAILSVSQASLAAQYTAPVARTANLEKSHTIDQLECTSSGIYQLKGGAGFPPMVGASELGCKLSQATSFLQFFFGVVLSAFQSCSTWDVSIKQCFK